MLNYFFNYALAVFIRQRSHCFVGYQDHKDTCAVVEQCIANLSEETQQHSL